MSDECKKFGEGSRKWDICTGKADLPIEKINLYRKFWGLSNLTEVTGISKPVIYTPKSSNKFNRHKERSNKVGCSCRNKKAIPTGGPGTELNNIFKNSGVPSCQQCKNLAKKMDEWGVNGCREKIDEIVEDIMPRAIKWFEQNKPWINKLIPFDSFKITSIRLGVIYNVNKAIDLADAKIAKSRQLKKWNSPTSQISSEKLKIVHNFNPVFRIKTAIRTSYRKKPTLDNTISSMTNAGFEFPLIFADNNSPQIEDCIRWPEQYGPFKSFKNMSEYLISDYTGWLLICEDDVEFNIGLADFIREVNLNKNQIITFYMSERQENILSASNGFNVLHGDIWGSLAYFVHSESLKQIIESNTFINWDSERRVDRVFCKSVEECGFELIHYKPSLAQHVGDTSTLSRVKRLDGNRVSATYSNERHNNNIITIITPTGDRPESFKLCERWFKNQRYTGEIQWIVIDDGVVPTEINYATDILRLNPIDNHSLCRNIKEAIPLIKGSHILIMEDDDYYGPDYISVMIGRLKHADLVGEISGKYYYIYDNKYKLSKYNSHVSFCRTGFNKNVLETLVSVVENTNHPSIDERLWSKWSGSKYVWKDNCDESRMCISIKGCSGRQSHGSVAPYSAISDTETNMLKKWIGDDIKYYNLTKNNNEYN